MHKHFIVVSAIFLFSGCKMQEKTYHANLNDVADEYVKLTLAIGQYDPDFIEALKNGFPESAGIALGVDRLAMLLTGSENIRDVIWAPLD